MSALSSSVTDLQESRIFSRQTNRKSVEENNIGKFHNKNKHKSAFSARTRATPAPVLLALCTRGVRLVLKNEKFWKAASIIITTCLLMAVMPEVRLLGLLIELMGLDMLLMVIGGYFLFPLKWAYSKSIRPVLYHANSVLEKLDPYYFVARRKDIAECPQLIVHAVPCLIGLIFWFSFNGWLYA